MPLLFYVVICQLYSNSTGLVVEAGQCYSVANSKYSACAYQMIKRLRLFFMRPRGDWNRKLWFAVNGDD